MSETVGKKLKGQLPILRTEAEEQKVREKTAKTPPLLYKTPFTLPRSVKY